MDKVIVAIFDTESKACEGYKALKVLNAEGFITLYADAVIAKDLHGKISVKEAVEQGPLGTVVGLFTGSLIGLLGGPIGTVLGASTGTLGGMLYDLVNFGINEDFLNEIGENLQPGKVAVVAEIWEEWIMPVDASIEALGGVVFRQPIEEAPFTLFDRFERDVETVEAEIASLEAEHKQVTGEAKNKLQAKIDMAKAKLKNSQDRVKATVETINQKIEAKIQSMKEQATKVPEKMKDKIEARIASIQSKYKQRTKKLSQAWELIKEAVTV